MCRLAYPVKKSLTWKVSCLYLMSIYTFTLFGILFVITAHTIERILSDFEVLNNLFKFCYLHSKSDSL